MVIDIHTHTFPDKLAAPTIRKLQGACHTRAFTDATNAGLAASMARAGIDCSVVLPVATNPHQVAHVNESAAQINARGRGTGIYSFGCIHPDCPDPRGELAPDRRPGSEGHQAPPRLSGHPVRRYPLSAHPGPGRRAGARGPHPRRHRHRHPRPHLLRPGDGAPRPGTGGPGDLDPGPHGRLAPVGPGRGPAPPVQRAAGYRLFLRRPHPLEGHPFRRTSCT